MKTIITALRKSHRYARTILLADPSNEFVASWYREIGAALAECIGDAGPMEAEGNSNN